MNSAKYKSDNFKCVYCSKDIDDGTKAGIKNRNHCPFCLRSVHVDLTVSGDRKSECTGRMDPIALSFKKVKVNKYKKEEKGLGEIMLVHHCIKCGKVSLNRIAGDDATKELENVFNKSQKISAGLIDRIKENKIEIIKKSQKKLLESCLYGK